MKTSNLFIIGLLFATWSCSNIEDATPAKRNTFVRFYEATDGLYGIAAEPVADGYVLLANEISANRIISRLMHINALGDEIVSDRVILPNLLAKALTLGPAGYYVTGDRIQINPLSENLFDLSVSSAVLYKISMQGDTTAYVAADTASVGKTDLHGNSVTLDANGNVILLGTFLQAKPAANERPFVTALDPETLDTVWTKRYDVIDRDYVNSKSVHATASGNIIWASALLRETGDISRTYLSVPYVREESVFINNDVYGETTDQQLFPLDIQPAESSPFGYGVIGTYAQPNGTLSNIFFLRVDKDGNIVTGSERFFDGEKLAENSLVTANESLSEDIGSALTATRDGGFLLAGSMETTPARGNGGLDIVLIKVDAQGNIQWNKILGGIGDETVNTIRETASGDLVLCGSNDLGLSSAFIIKMNAQGEVKE